MSFDDLVVGVTLLHIALVEMQLAVAYVRFYRCPVMRQQRYSPPPAENVRRHMNKVCRRWREPPEDACHWQVRIRGVPTPL